MVRDRVGAAVLMMSCCNADGALDVAYRLLSLVLSLVRQHESSMVILLLDTRFVGKMMECKLVEKDLMMCTGVS